MGNRRGRLKSSLNLAKGKHWKSLSTANWNWLNAQSWKENMTFHVCFGEISLQKKWLELQLEERNGVS